MELTLKRLLEQAEFTTARKGGYDQGEVDEFLDRAVAMATKVEAKLTETMGLASAAPAAPAGPTAEEVEAEVERRVAARLAEAPPAPTAPTGPSEEDMAEEVRRTIVLAQRTADAAIREAREEAAALLAEANERAAAVHAEADALSASSRHEVATEAAAERNAARERLAAEIGELDAVREAVRSDVTVLERHVEEQRSQLRSTLGELQRLLDDPAGFRLAPTPALLEPELPDLTPEPAPVEATSAPVAEPDPVPAPDAEAEPVEPTPPPVAQTAVVIEDAPAAPPSLSFDEVDHAAPGLHDTLDAGPPTAPVSAVDLGIAPPAAAGPSGDGEEDAFLAELRKAMADEEPLGPRDQGETQTADMFDDDERRGWRRGKRR